MLSLTALLCAVGIDAVRPVVRNFQLGDAALSGDAARSVRLLHEGADPNGLCAYGTNRFTPLMNAARRGSASVVGLLLQSGGDPKSHNDTESALTLAAGSGDLGTVQVLLHAGADPNWQGETGDTALSLARDLHRHEVEAYLVRKGAYH